MRVKLKQKWFVKDEPYEMFGRVFTGQLYRKGEHDMPEEMFEKLPRDKNGQLVPWVEILEGGQEEEVSEEPNTLSALTAKRMEFDPMERAIKQVEQATDKMAAARAAKLRKKLEGK